jgi:hypothetical protein
LKARHEHPLEESDTTPFYGTGVRTLEMELDGRMYVIVVTENVLVTRGKIGLLPIFDRSQS